jgi:hypothetical protein
MSEIPDSIKSRIRKMLAVSNDPNANTNMAEIAASKVQAMLAEYNLELNQVALGEGDGKSAADPDAARGRFDGLATRSEWQSTILKAVARNNFCLVYRDWSAGDDPECYGLIGRKLNMLTTMQVYQYLIQTIERLCPIKDKRRAKFINSFKEGCADRLNGRLNAQRAESEAASRAKRGEQPRGDGSSLVLADVYSTEEDLNNDFRNGWEVGRSARERMASEARWAAEREARRNAPPEPERVLTAEERREREAAEKESRRYWKRRDAEEAAKRDPAAYAMGRDAGATISLNRQVTADRAPARIGHTA